MVDIALHRLESPSPAATGRQQIVLRPRVVDGIVERLERHGFVRLIAPPGSGKTTALEQMAAAIDLPGAWLIADEWHRSPGQLAEEIITALDPVAPGLRGRIDRERAFESGPRHAAALAGSLAGHRQAVLVVDNCHVLAGSSDAEAVICSLLRHRGSGLRVVLAGRAEPSLSGLGLGALDPAALIGEDMLRATLDEAQAILRSHGSDADAQIALDATGGWVAGLVFETWSAQGAGIDPMATFLEREVRSALSPEDDRLLVASSVFDTVDEGRLAALGSADAQGLLMRLRLGGLPAQWTQNGSVMRLDPRIRDVFRAELEHGHSADRHAVYRAAAQAYEHEGQLERALELSLAAGDADEAGRLLPQVIVSVVERGDAHLADTYLQAVKLDPEPGPVVLARILLAMRRQATAEGLATLDELGDRRLAALVAEQPLLGAFACNVFAAARDRSRAERVLDCMPPGRAADAARFLLSNLRDDRDAPIPAFVGDSVDIVVARGLWCRGKLHLLDQASESVVRASGAPHAGLVRGTAMESDLSPLAAIIISLSHGIEARDIVEARAALAALEERPAPIWAALGEAEIAVRIERNPEAALAAAGRAQSGILFFDELGALWKGAAFLLREDAEAAARVLRDAVASMRRGDRTLGLPAALVYLAEAEWRLGNEEKSDRAADDALGVAREQGGMRNLLLALADFPGVTSRRLDAEPSGDSPWHALGRALVLGTERPGVMPRRAGVHLHDLGEPVLVVEGGTVVRTKIRKSLELLAFLLARPAARATRAEILTALWNGRDDDSSRAYVRQALRHLRDAIEPAVTVVADGDSLAIAGAVTADSLTLDALVGSAALEQGQRRLGILLDVLALADRGVFLDGSNDVTWVDDRRERLESLVADVRLDAAALFVELDRHLDALRLVDDALAKSPLLERGWRLKMTALSLLGDDDGVLGAYDRCRAALGQIGLGPSPTTTSLVQRLRR